MTKDQKIDINDCMRDSLLDNNKNNTKPVKVNSDEMAIESMLESLGKEVEDEYQTIYNKKRRMLAIQSGVLVSENLKMANFGGAVLTFLALILSFMVSFTAVLFLFAFFKLPSFFALIGFLLPGYCLFSQNKLSTYDIRKTIGESKEVIKYQLLQRKRIKESDLKIIKDTYGEEFLLKMFGDKENVFYSDFFRVKSVYDKIERIRDKVQKI